MLQQTQVATVGRYFPRFLAAFPTMVALAAAEEDEVLRLWEGLGYYRRARQMHAAAKIMVAEHRGKFPRDPDVVRGLPGIGRYTAGAILSISFDARLPILEANTIRLLSRLVALRGDTSAGACAETAVAYRRVAVAGSRDRRHESGADGVGQLDLHAAKPTLRRLPIEIALRRSAARIAGADSRSAASAENGKPARGGCSDPAA